MWRHTQARSRPAKQGERAVLVRPRTSDDLSLWLSQAKSQFKQRSTANNVEIVVPVPPDADSPSFKTSIGTVKYAPERDAVVWSIKQFHGARRQSIQQLWERRLLAGHQAACGERGRDALARRLALVGTALMVRRYSRALSICAQQTTGEGPTSPRREAHTTAPRTAFTRALICEASLAHTRVQVGRST